MSQATVGYLDSNGNWVPVRTGSPLPTSGGGGGAVQSVNGQTGDVSITAESLGAATETDVTAALETKADDSTVDALSAQVSGVESDVVDLQDEGYDIIIAVGQSNMRGNGAPFSAATDPVHPQIDMFAAASILPAEEPVWVPNPPANGIGPALQFARHYASGSLKPNRRVLIVATAYGGTGLVGSSGPTWNPARTDSLYQESLDRVAAAQAAIPADLQAGSRVVSVLWLQGEKDYQDAVSAATYKSTLIDLIDAYRTDLSLPDLPFIMGPLSPDNLGDFGGTGLEINQAQTEIPYEVPMTGWAAPELGLYNSDDPLHYSAEGQRVNGLRMYEEYVRVTNRLAPVNPVRTAGWNTLILSDDFSVPSEFPYPTPVGAVTPIVSPGTVAQIDGATGRLEIPSSEVDHAMVLWDPGTQDYQFTGAVAIGVAPNTRPGVVFWAKDFQNWFSYRPDGAGNWILIRCFEGTVTTMASTTIAASGGPWVVTCLGAHVSLVHPATETTVHQITLAGIRRPEFSGWRKAGFYRATSAGTGSPEFDNLSIYTF